MSAATWIGSFLGSVIGVTAMWGKGWRLTLSVVMYTSLTMALLFSIAAKVGA